MDLCIALGPIGVYLLVIGILNLSKRPLVINGARDLFALSLAICGLAVVGPMDLFMPETSAAFFRGWVWIPLIILYALLALLVCLLVRPRIVIYNITAEQLRPVLQQVTSELDPDVHWAGDAMTMPNKALQLYVQAPPGTRNVQLIAAGGDQSPTAWRQLQLGLSSAVKDTEVGINPRGLGMVFAASIMLGMIGFALLNGREMIVERMEDFLRF